MAKKYVFTYTSDTELMQLYERSVLDLGYLADMCAKTSGQAYACFFRQHEIEECYQAQIEAELRARGRMQ